MKWYKKLAFELLLNSVVLNAYILFKNISKKNMSITQFRKKLVVHLINCQDEEILNSNTATISRNKLQQKTGRVSKVRRYCKKCYEDNAARFGRDIARKITKQVITFCGTCKGKPFLSLPCFNNTH